MKAKIHVTLKQGILDPQGKAIEQWFRSMVRVLTYRSTGSASSSTS